MPDKNDMSIHIPENEYEEATKYDKKMYQWLLNKRNISTNSIEAQAIIDQLPVGPLCGYFDAKPCRNEFNCVDNNKAYTSNLYEMEYLPVYNIFDDYLPYDGHEIEDYSNYVCELEENNNRGAIISGMSKIFRQEGYVLKRIKNIR